MKGKMGLHGVEDGEARLLAAGEGFVKRNKVVLHGGVLAHARVEGLEGRHTGSPGALAKALLQNRQ